MKIRIKFKKQGPMKFIGHLDIMRFFQKAMRRADVDIRYSEGFSPHQIMSFASPLGVGITGSGEYMDIEVLSTESSAKMMKRINKVLTEDIEILSYRRLPDHAANAMSLVAACDYTICLRKEAAASIGMSAEEFFKGLCSFIKEGDLTIMKKTKKGEKEMDLRPFIYEYRVISDSSNPSDVSDFRDAGIFLKLSAGSSVNIKPDLLLEAYCCFLGIEFPAFGFLINREEVYADAGTENNHKFIALEAYGEDIE